tara:strand:- start:205 stop:984 length:780 start_codon:yes stop_codon:yes gene_type:complete
MTRNLSVVPLPNEFFVSPIAHRGLHDCDGRFGSGRTENSFAACTFAMSEGFGVEVDIQLSEDGVPVVFHDDNLKRLLKVNKKVNELPLNSLKKLRLANKEQIPTLDELLEMISGQVPVLIEMKEQNSPFGNNISGIVDAVARSLKRYTGPIGVMSFNTSYVKVFGSKLPDIPRGLITEAFTDNGGQNVSMKKPSIFRCLKELEEIAVSFISHEHSDLDSDFILAVPEPTKIFSWTIRNKRELNKALKRSDNITFEGFIP